MALTLEQQRLREGRVTAGFAPYLMAGKEERILSEWLRIVGHPEHKDPDFSEMWNLHYGSAIEPIALDWHEKKTGQPLTRRGEVVQHPDLPYVCATLDAYRADDDCVLDCKAWSSWQKVDYICSFLTPQIIVQRGCTKAARGGLLLVHGGTEPIECPLTWSAEYEAEVWERIALFWQSVMDLSPPASYAAKHAPIQAVKRYDMAGSNSWAEHAGNWLATYKQARSNKIATDELKKLVPKDSIECFGHGVVIIRDRANRLSVKELR